MLRRCLPMGGAGGGVCLGVESRTCVKTLPSRAVIKFYSIQFCCDLTF